MKDTICLWLAYRLPVRLVHWCFVRVSTHGTVGKYENQIMSQLTVLEANERWYTDKVLTPKESESLDVTSY